MSTATRTAWQLESWTANGHCFEAQMRFDREHEARNVINGLIALKKSSGVAVNTRHDEWAWLRGNRFVCWRLVEVEVQE